MGSFNVSCGLSNLTIRPGDPVVYIPLVNSERSSGGEFSNFYVYPTAKFSQCLPPLHGVYADYGNVKELREGITASLVRAQFHLSPEQFIQCVGNYGRDLYSDFGPIAQCYPNTLTERCYLGGRDMEEARHLLTAVGFQEPREGTFTWAREGASPTASISISGDHAQRWVGSVLNADGEVKWSKELDVFGLGPERALEEMTEFLHILPGFPEEHWSAIRNLRSMSGMFIHGDVYSEMMKLFLPEAQDSLERAEKDILATEDRFKVLDVKLLNREAMSPEELREISTAFIEAAWKLDDCTREYIHVLGAPSKAFQNLRKHGDAVKATMEMLRLYRVMEATNRIFTPGIDSGFQVDGEAMEKLSTLTLGIIKARREEDDEWS